MLYVPPINTTYFFDAAPRKIKREKEERNFASKKGGFQILSIATPHSHF